MSIVAFAQMLGALRTSGRAMPLSAAEALLWIASGVDSVPELAEVMGPGDDALPAATVSRLVSLLRGRARYSQGKWIESPHRLIEVRPHPHRRGMQLLLTREALDLLQPCRDTVYICSAHIGANCPGRTGDTL
jgi:hypothetical protein